MIESETIIDNLTFHYLGIHKLNFRNSRNSDSDTRLKTRLEAILKFFDTRTRSKFKIF